MSVIGLLIIVRDINYRGFHYREFIILLCVSIKGGVHYRGVFYQRVL